MPLTLDVHVGRVDPLIDITTPSNVKPNGLPSYSGRMAFSDEFNGSTVDGNRWQNGGWDPASMAPGSPDWQAHTTNHETGDATNNFGWDPQQYDPSAVSVEDSSLVITMSSENLVPGQTNPSFPFKSGMIHTSNRFAPVGGFFEVRAKFSGKVGSWPAAWLIPQNFSWPPEDDIVENWGQTPNNSTYGYFQPDRTHTGGNLSGDSTQWHTYGLHWQPGVAMTHYYDGVAQTPLTANVTSLPMYFILNHAADYRAALQPSAGDMPFNVMFDYARAWALDN